MKKFLALPLLALSGLLMGGCFTKNYQGDLVGAEDRPIFNPQDVPFGMVPCPGGTFHMGQTDQDISASMVNMNKQVTIAGFYMDETEITNNEYRQFVGAIMQDSVEALGEDYIKTELYPDTTVWVCVTLRTTWVTRCWNTTIRTLLLMTTQ
jgi:sulfatase modifying factor 1